ncbi:MAG: type II toxin-antitoxin system prevent-host-death family antitoxin [Actinomycetales bacterium]|nr:type II toxin-antitoxin system prevent-host-death family antitoxin [Actinomycetales bacterium]
MTRLVTIIEANARLPELLSEVEAGEDVVITRNGQAVARLIKIADRCGVRPGYGSLQGKLWFAPDFDDPLPEFDVVHGGS